MRAIRRQTRPARNALVEGSLRSPRIDEMRFRIAQSPGCENRNGYKQSLVSQWLPALEGVVPQLEAGITVADIGCGHGYSTILMAQAFPRSRFLGFDAHAQSIEAARRGAHE
jgi:tRNA G46 methylase TrmB